MVPEWLFSALLPALVSALVTWGTIRKELQWLRRDVDLAHKRIDHLQDQIFQQGKA